MNVAQLDWYLNAIKHEIGQVNEDFVGNVDFKFNIKQNSITNMNVNLAKSLKKPDVSRDTF